MTCGLRASGIQVIAGIDNDSSCQATFEKNNKGAVFLDRDIAAYQPAALASDLKIKKRDDYMVFAACAPCQFWTQIHTNKRKSKKTQNLILNFKSFVEYFKPGFVFMENVPGVSSKNPARVFISALKEMEYHVADKIIDMSLYSIPQKRKRFALLASRISKMSFPRPQQARAAVKDVLGKRNGFPPIKAGAKDKTAFLHTAARLSKKKHTAAENDQKRRRRQISLDDKKKLSAPLLH